ncbi:MAG: DUF2927 domain-containing protein [Clostridia bacterium]|nr:DUF2927 domain-containing protein [Clostridia bacterium]
MKRICWLLVLLLLFTGCAAPTETPLSSVPASSAEQSVASLPNSAKEESSAESPEASSEVSSAVSSETSSEESAVTSVENVSSQAPEISSSEAEEPSSSEPETSLESSETPVSSEEHSTLYIPGLSVEDVILYFNEVCLDAEYVNTGDATLVQKWTGPICYELYGDYTAADADLVKALAGILNEIEGFPGMYQSSGEDYPVLRISFYTAEDLMAQMGSVVNYETVDGAVEYWYDGENQIYDARIGIRCDIDQYLRNSVILEEIYNGLGPIQDTWQREDSIAYAGYSEPQWPTEVDLLILKLLYHPDMLCGMDAAACEDVIRSLYY